MKSGNMETVAITGSGGYDRQHLIAHLKNRDWCSRVKNLLEWNPGHTARETLRIMFEAHDFELVKKGEHEAQFRNGG